MLACVDVDYREDETVAACVLADGWAAAEPVGEHVLRTAGAAPAYEPGEFFRRELPFLVEVLGALEAPPTVVVVDGYVWLADGKAGLGSHLHEALGGATAVVGVAKRAFRGASAIEVYRGRSQRPLHVTAAGVDASAAARAVVAMHGDHRIPTLLKRVDRLCRDHRR